MVSHKGLILSLACVLATAAGVPVAAEETISKEQRAILLEDVTRAHTLLKTDGIEQFIEDYYPINLVRPARQRQVIGNMANDLRRSKATLKRLEKKLEQCQAGTINGNDSDVTFMPPAEPAPAKPAVVAPVVKPVVQVAPAPAGYGKELLPALTLASADLKAGKFKVFVEKMLPATEVARLTTSEQIETTTQVLTDNPEMVKSMLADMAEIAKLKPKAVENLVQVTLPGRTKGETPREIRFQLVGGSWRFFDQSSDVHAKREVLMEKAGNMEANPGAFEPVLKFERIREHWRLLELPQ